jgi:hypothetical protein
VLYNVSYTFFKNNVVIGVVLMRFGKCISVGLNGKEVNLVVLNMGGDKADTSTAIGKLMITVLSGIA